MKDSLPTPPGVRSTLLSVRLARRCLSVAAGCITGLLLSTGLIGCSDSHSDEYVEFADLAPNPAAEEVEESPETPSQDPTDDSEQDAAADANATAGTDEQPVQTPAANVQERPDAASEIQTASHTKDPFLSEPRKPSDRSPSAGPDGDPAKTKEPLPIKLLIPHRQFRKEGTALRATFDDIDLLKVLNMEPVPINAVDHFPDWLNQLNGARVRIRGYMRPGFEAEDLTEFLFVRDNGECCYGPMPKIYDMIAVQLADGESTDLIEGTPFDVEGTLRIDPHADEVELFALFFIDDGVIID